MPAVSFVLFAMRVLCASGFRRRDAYEVLAQPATGANASSSLLSTEESWVGWRMLPMPFAIGTWRPRHRLAPSDVAPLRSGSPPLEVPPRGLPKLSAKKKTQTETEVPSSITEATVDCIHQGSTSVLLPSEWVRRFDLEAEETVEVFTNSPGLQRFRAQLRCDPNFRVEVVGRRTADPDVRRELYISRRVASAYTTRSLLGSQRLGGVEPLLDFVEVEGWTFVLRSLADGDLEDYFMRGIFQPKPGASFSHLHQGLLALIGILRGLRTLSSLGIIHNSISCDMVAYNGDAPFIYDLSSACLVHDGDVGLRCCDAVEGMGTSAQPAHYQAPEVTHGVPTGPENDVWSAGMFFLEMCVGSAPTRMLWFEDDEEDPFDLRPEQREEVRAFTRESFNLTSIDKFRSLPKPVKKLLRGMLRKDPAKRWTAKASLERALLVAAKLGLPSPKEPSLRVMPDSYSYTAFE